MFSQELPSSVTPMESDEETAPSSMCFSQYLPEQSQAPLDARPTEAKRLQEIDAISRQNLVTSVSRHMLFKALSGEPIDRSKLNKEAFPSNLTSERVVNAVVKEATLRMENVLGLTVQRPHDFVLKNKQMPAKFKDRLYIVNKIKDDDMGNHSKSIHSIHIDSQVQNGLLMLILSFIYCKGEVKDHMRWLEAGVLYRLLHSIDENIPAVPQTGKHSHGGNITTMSILSPDAMDASAGSASLSPDVDIALEKFVHMDYLVKKKFERGGDVLQDDVFSYAIGPKAYLEVGRKQIIHFCAQVLDQAPDPTMLHEIEEEEEQEQEQVNEEMQE